MKRTLIVTAFLAMGLLVASSFAAAQDAPATTTGGQVTIGFLNATQVDSSKFQEYRDLSNGLKIPYLNLFSKSSVLDFNVQALNVSRLDQRYTGWANLSWVGLSFDYNQIPHNMGNNGHTMWSETAPGVWSMSPTLRATLGAAVDAVTSTARTYDFYAALLAPTWGSMNSVDLQGIRKRGEFEVDFSQKLPFDLKFTYMRELKVGNRGESSGTAYGVVQSLVDVPDAMNEVTTDYGVNFAWNFKKGNVHAAFNRNIYDDRQNGLLVDNAFRATDLAYVSASVPGGPAQVRYGTPPSNEASRGTLGFLLKFARQTRIAGDVALGTWTQNASFLPYTTNSTILTDLGQPANLANSVLASSLNGKINTTTLNFSFSSRPVEGLGVRLRYRSYDAANKTPIIVWPGTAGSGDVERKWTARPTAGFATSNPYSNKSAKFDGQVSYDVVKGLTLEAAYRYAKLDRTYVEAESGKNTGYAFSAVYHLNDLFGFRGVYDQTKLTASGYDATPGVYIGLASNESERKTTRTGVDIEISPSDSVDLTLAYARRKDEYPNRPARGIGLDPATTSSGLLSGSYDSITAEIEFNPSERVELSAYYTYERNLASDRNITLTSGAVNNSLRYDVTDKTSSFGANAVFQFVPDKWTFSLMARHQKVNGLLDVFAANAAGSFMTGRTNNGFAGTQPIDDWDDTLLTTASAQLDFAITKMWKLSAGYMYEKYTFSDAFTAGTTPMPASPLFFMKANDGNYIARVIYAKLGYRF